MNKLIFRLGLALSLIMLLFSCSETAEHQNLLPKNTTALVSIKLDQISKKANISKEDKALFMDKIFKNQDDEFAQKLKPFFEDPSKSGIDTKEPIYFFTNIKDLDKEEGTIGFTLKLEDQDKFKELFLQCDEAKSFKEGELAGYQTLTRLAQADSCLVNDCSVLAFNDKQAIMLFSKKDLSEEVLKGILSQKAENSFASEKVFQELASKDDDISLIMNYSILMNSSEFQKLQGANPISSMIQADVQKMIPKEGVFYCFGMNASKGKFTINSSVNSENEAYTKLLETAIQSFPELSGKFFPMIPQKSLYTVALGLDGEALYSYMQMIMPSLMEQMEKGISEEMPELGTIKDIVSSFKGDNILSVEASPSFMADKDVKVRTFISLANSEKASQLLKLLVEKNGVIKEIAKDEYKYSVFGFADIFMGIKDNVLYAKMLKTGTTEEVFAEHTPNILENPFKSSLENKRVSFIFNISEVMNLVKPMLMMYVSQEILTQLEQIDYLTVENLKDPSCSKIELKFKGEENPYATAVKIIKQLSIR